MGPTTEELDSLNELIHFDHIYYKTSQPASTPKSAPDTNCIQVVMKTSKSDIQPKVVSIIKRRVSAQPVVTEVEKVEPVVDDVNLDIAEADLVSLASQLEEIIDFDSIMNLDVIATKDESSTGSSSCVTGLTGDSSNAISVDNITACPLKRKYDDMSAPSNNSPIVLSDSFEMNHASSLYQSAQSESGYSSDLSDVASPKSDISMEGSLGPDMLWEDSLSELFPSLI